MKARNGIALVAMLLVLEGCFSNPFAIVVRRFYPAATYYQPVIPKVVVYLNPNGGYGYQQGFQPPQPPPYYSHTAPPQPRLGWYYYGQRPPPAAVQPTKPPPISQDIEHGAGNAKFD